MASQAGIKQLRIAETEKYAHVTYFFNGGEEKKFPGEERILIPSPKDVATYDLKPEMSARPVTEALVKHLRETDVGLVIANYANADMVGHTGNFEASVKAVRGDRRVPRQSRGRGARPRRAKSSSPPIMATSNN